MVSECKLKLNLSDKTQLEDLDYLLLLLPRFGHRRSTMCIQIVERYSECRCLYYRYAVEVCSARIQPGHIIEERVVRVGYACPDHPRKFPRPGTQVEDAIKDPSLLGGRKWRSKSRVFTGNAKHKDTYSIEGEQRSHKSRVFTGDAEVKSDQPTAEEERLQEASKPDAGDTKLQRFNEEQQRPREEIREKKSIFRILRIRLMHWGAPRAGPQDRVTYGPLRSPPKINFDLAFGADTVVPNDAFKNNFDDLAIDDDPANHNDVVAAVNVETLTSHEIGIEAQDSGVCLDEYAVDMQNLADAYSGEDSGAMLTRENAIKKPNLTPPTKHVEFARYVEASYIILRRTANRFGLVVPEFESTTYPSTYLKTICGCVSPAATLIISTNLIRVCSNIMVPLSLSTYPATLSTAPLAQPLSRTGMFVMLKMQWPTSKT